MEIKVRRAIDSDREPVLAFITRMLGEDGEWGDYVIDSWDDWAKGERGVLLVAECDGRPAGTAHLNIMNPSQGWFGGMRVDRDYRRLGIGSALTQHLLRASKDLGLKEAFLAIDEYNMPSQEMTARAGFKLLHRYALLRHDRGVAVASPAIQPARLARSDELDALMTTARTSALRDGAPAAAFVGWEWETLTGDSLRGLVDRRAIRVHPILGAEAWTAYSYFQREHEGWAFAPYGEPQAVAEVVCSLYWEIGKEREPAEFGVYVNRDSAVAAALEACGFSTHKSTAPAVDGWDREGWQVWGHKLD
jgi:GNAT superfamily N-acetyltransferase